jgi:endogenous inhibitor of DNA gyrase (YacG/DUF329 family)
MTYEPITFAMAAAGLQALAKVDIHNAPPSTWRYRPFQCHRCLDLRWVSDWANWPVGWAWQRVQPVPRVPCPDCNDGVGP